MCSSDLFGARGPATLLTRMTAILAAVFFLNSIGLAYLAREASLEGKSVVERYQEQGIEEVSGEGFVPSPGEGLGTVPTEVPELPGASGDAES